MQNDHKMSTRDLNNITVEPYAGGNETIDRLRRDYFPDDSIWIVQGAGGRKVIPATSPEAAKDRYVEIYETKLAQFNS